MFKNLSIIPVDSNSDSKSDTDETSKYSSTEYELADIYQTRRDEQSLVQYKHDVAHIGFSANLHISHTEPSYKWQVTEGGWDLNLIPEDHSVVEHNQRAIGTRFVFANSDNRFGDNHTSDLETSDEEEAEHTSSFEDSMYQRSHFTDSQNANVVERDTFWTDRDIRETIATRRIFFDDDDYDEDNFDGSGVHYA